MKGDAPQRSMRDEVPDGITSAAFESQAQSSSDTLPAMALDAPPVICFPFSMTTEGCEKFAS